MPRFTTSRVIDGYDFTWFTYYILATAALGTVLTALWPFKSRIYENGRPMVQEILLNGLMAGLFGFAGAWQLYLTFSGNLDMNMFYLGSGGAQQGFLCPTDNHDNTVHCRLWQTQLIGCLACAAVFAIVALVWTVLFRRRPLAFKDLPDSLKENEMITSPRMEEAAKREEEQDRQEEIAAIAAEAEKRAALSRVKPQTRPTHPYQQNTHQQYPVSRTAAPAPAHLQHQNSASYLNQGYDSRESPLPQSNYSNDDGDTYYNGNYAQQQQAYEMNNTNQHGYGRHGGAVSTPGPGVGARAVTPHGNPYAEDPLALAGANPGFNNNSNNNTGYYPVATPGTSQLQHTAAYNNNNEYAYGHFTPGETFDDPSSQEAQAHLAYANQLREQQLYHEQMAEALQKQKQQKVVKQQQEYEDRGVPHSGSTANFFPKPLSHNSSMPPISNGSTNIVAGGNSTSAVTAAPLSRRSGDFGAAAAYTRPPNTSSNLQHSGLVTPGSNISGTRIAGSPQLYDDTATIPDSQYSYDRYRAEVLGDLRPPNTRAATMPGAPQDHSPATEHAAYHDYKVQVTSPVADPSRVSTSSSSGAGSYSQTQGYVPPPTKSRTMWS
ncbi:hypothetical protein BGZ96_007245 [Linnemannia gamsii]|uniref:MARVEL domain-containing protein n=1 Tax=Linnemannia gamsii TaxID=64522 RepID=A0ABQ7K0V3_9FUNG|nr:hypothetical protein BGZ96_007245 [Linnemannia gamsii]